MEPDRNTASPPLSVGQCATLACLLEVSVPKPGNVHRGADFEDVTFVDYAVSAAAIAPAMENASQSGVGTAVLEAVEATRRLVTSNTNLGSVLLLAPLAAVPREQPIGSGVASCLSQLTPQDAAAAYQAIRLAEPGGMGTVSRMDVRDEAPTDLLTAMQEAAERDLIAVQYVDHFRTVFEEVVPSLTAGRQRGWSFVETVIHTQLELLNRHGDSLIARKCGPDIARQAGLRAGRVLDAGPPSSEAYLEALSDLDFWLRSDHHQRNPGTSADLIAAGLFVALRDHLIHPPFV